MNSKNNDLCIHNIKSKVNRIRYNKNANNNANNICFIIYENK